MAVEKILRIGNASKRLFGQESSPPNSNENMAEKWERLESALTESAKSKLQYYEHWKQPDWFQESMKILEPLL